WPSTVAPSFILIKPYTSVWESTEQKTSQSSPVFTKYRRALPETPMMRRKSSKGIWWEAAPPYTLNVPPAHPRALNIGQPEFSWAQSLVVAMHSIKLA
ncbi:MAG: hypothetical protein ACKPKO_17150, partial [Candidatus Fonsibacter sp.]